MADNYLEEYTATDDEFFGHYEPTTNEPGQWLTILTISYIAGAAVLLGPAVVLGRKLKKYLKARRSQHVERPSDAYHAKNDDDEEAADTALDGSVEPSDYDNDDTIATVAVEDENGDGQLIIQVPQQTSLFQDLLFSKPLHRAVSRGMSRSRPWRSVTDESTGGLYWYNRYTGDVTWEEPPESMRYQPPLGEVVPPTGDWIPLFDRHSHVFYWYNRATKQASWECPSDILEDYSDDSVIATDDVPESMVCGGILDFASEADSSDDDSSDSSDDDSTYEDYDFDELPIRAREAAMLLGYTASLWDKSIPPPTEELDWDELTKEQQRAAEILGYNELEWDGDESDDSDDSVVSDDGPKEQRKPDIKIHKEKEPKVSESDDDGGLYDELEWNELPSKVKKAAKTLGYDRRLWDFGTHGVTGLSTSATEEKSWKRLTEEEREAAKKLGYTSALWNHEPREFDQTKEILRGWQTFSRVVSFDRESKQIFRLALPFTAEAIVDSLLDAVVSAVISSYLGPTVFTAYAMVEVFFSFTDSFSDAVGEASEILIAQALGVGNFFLAGQYVQLAVVVWLMIDVPVLIVWIFCIDKAILALGLGAEMAAYAKAYVPIAAFAGIIEGIVSSANGLLSCDGKAKAIFFIDSTFAAVHTVAVGVAVTKFNVDLVGIAWIEVIAAVIYGVFLSLFLSYKGWLNPYKKGIFRNLSMKNWPLVKAVFKMGVPLSFGYVLSNGEWEVLTFFAAAMGPAEVAAWSIAGAIWEVMEDAPSGISSAAVVRIGIHLGKGNPVTAKVTSYKSLLYSCIWAAVLTGLFVAFSSDIIHFFTEDPVLVEMLHSLVLLIAAGNVLMVLGTDAWHIVSAQARGKEATAALFIGMWCITLPLSVYFVFVQNYDLHALGAAVMIGYASIAFVLLYLVFTSSWAKISMKAIAKASRSV